MVENSSSYGKIFKSTFLFGFVQVFNILAKVGINKAVAVFLGTEGMGVIGLLQSTLQVLSTACGFGVSQSAVKDISEGSSTSSEQFNRAISLTKKLILLTSVIGLVVTIILSPWLSEWTFGSDKYTYIFAILSVVVFLQIIAEGQLAILKGARMLRLLAKASLFGAIIGLLTSVPLYYWLGEDGIAPSLIMAALTATLFSWYYSRKVNYQKQAYSTIKALKDGKIMIQMGLALMYVSFLGVLSDYLIRTFIANTSSIEQVGLFQAGAMIVTSYFGIIITALTTDYYPRIAAINKDDKALAIEFNKQSEVGVLMIGLMVLIFMFTMPLFVDILYTAAFIPVIPFLQYAVFGVLCTVISNALGMILLAKQAARVFFFTATIGRIVVVSVSFLFFNWWGLEGLGIAAATTGLFHLLFMSVVLRMNYNILMNKRLLQMLLVNIVLSICAFFVKEIEQAFIKYLIGGVLVGIYLLYAKMQIKKIMNIDILIFIRRKIGKK